MNRGRRAASLALALGILAASVAAGGFAGVRAWQRGRPRVVVDTGSPSRAALCAVSPLGDVVAVWEDEANTSAVVQGPDLDHSVRLYSTEDGARVGELVDPEGVRGVAFSRSGERIATLAPRADGGGSVRIWDVLSRSTVLTIPTGPPAGDPRSRLRFLPGDEGVAINANGGQFGDWGWQLLSLTPRAGVAPVVTNDFMGRGFAAFPGDGWCYFANADGVSRSSVSPPRREGLVSWRGTVSFALSERCDLAVRHVSPELELRRLPDGAVVRRIPIDGVAMCLALSPDSRLLAASVHSATPPTTGAVVVWSIPDARELARFPGVFANDLAFSPTRDLLVGTEDGNLHLWPFRR